MTASKTASIFFVGDIHCEGRRFSAGGDDLIRDGFACFFVDVRDDDDGPLLCERECICFPMPRCAPVMRATLPERSNIEEGGSVICNHEV